MSRPPRPHFRNSTTGTPPAQAEHIRYQPLGFKDLVDLQVSLADQEAALGVPASEGDFARSLMEMSALLGYALGAYQNLYAREVYLGTAQLPQSLIRHARRLAYEPDAGMAATGYAVFTIGQGLQGQLPKGFALSSSPKGEVKAQDYETLEAVDVNSDWNQIPPTHRRHAVKITFINGQTTFRLGMEGLDLQPGHSIVLWRPNGPWLGLIIETAQETQEQTIQGDTTVTEVTARLANPASPHTNAQFDINPTHESTVFRFLANPATELHLFGWDADMQAFPPDKLRDSGVYVAPQIPVSNPFTMIASAASPIVNNTEGGDHIEMASIVEAEPQFLVSNAPSSRPTETIPLPDHLDNADLIDSIIGQGGASTLKDVKYGYRVQTESGGGYHDQDIYLSSSIPDPRQGQFVLGVDDTGPTVFEVTAQQEATVAFFKGGLIDIPVTEFDEGGVPSTNTTQQLIETHLSGTVTVLRLRRAGGLPIKRSDLPVQSALLGGWQIDLPVLATQPNPTAATAPLELDGDLSGWRPGRRVVFSSLDETKNQDVEIYKYESTNHSTTKIWWTPTHIPWTLGNLKIFGNVGRISHGSGTEEVLGDSDGTSLFQTFKLKKSPVTRVPSAHGGNPEVEVRVNDVAWDRVGDFENSGTHDRHYLLQLDEEQKTTVMFGGGHQGKALGSGPDSAQEVFGAQTQGAIPPSGKKHIRASYRVGLGTVGNAQPGQVARIKKSHPLVDTAVNLTPISGGADPAGAQDVRHQATRYIRTFDRAVSVADHADLALLFPGVARASARWDDLEGVQLVAATAQGHAIEAQKELRAFLDERRDTQIPMQLCPPQPVDVYLTIKIEKDPAFLEQTVRETIQNSLYGTAEESPGLLTFASRQFGQTAHLSEVYRVVNNADGVHFIDVARFALSAGPAVHDALRVTSTQWLRLQPQNCEVLFQSGGVL